MKKLTISIATIITTLSLFCIFSIQSSAANASIVCPSDAETTIAEGRDFYVIGEYKETDPLVSVKVELKKNLISTYQTVRSLTTSTNNSVSTDKCIPTLDSVYGVGDGGVSIEKVCMPDLSYNSVTNANDESTKITFTKNNFSALILGGTSDFLGLTRTSTGMLDSGDYKIVVTINESTSNIVLEKDIKIAPTAQKVMARFSPDVHLNNVTEEAKKNTYRVYLDPFAGYWSPASYIYDGEQKLSSSVFLETKNRWRYNDALEYQTGNVHFYNYNVSPTSTTQSVEMGMIQFTQRIDTDLFTYYYDIGEPYINTKDGKLTGKFIPLDKNDKLEFTRGEIGEEKEIGSDNEYACYKTNNNEIDKNIDDGISITRGEDISIYGITAPIQNTEEDVTRNDDQTFTVANKIDKIKYSITDSNNKEILSSTKDVTINRELEEGWNSASIYEFKHVFDTCKLDEGNYKVVAECLDTNGKTVDGGQETFTLAIKLDKPNITTTTTTSATTTTAQATTTTITLTAPTTTENTNENPDTSNNSISGGIMIIALASMLLAIKGKKK